MEKKNPVLPLRRLIFNGFDVTRNRRSHSFRLFGVHLLLLLRYCWGSNFQCIYDSSSGYDSGGGGDGNRCINIANLFAIFIMHIGYTGTNRTWKKGGIAGQKRWKESLWSDIEMWLSSVITITLANMKDNMGYIAMDKRNCYHVLRRRVLTIIIVVVIC